MNLANQCDLNYKLRKNQPLQVELALLKMCHLTSAFNLATAPLNTMPSTEGQLKKKPDTPAVASQPTQEPAPVLSEPPTNYTTAKTPIMKSEPVVAKEAPAAEKPKVFIPNLHSAGTSVKIPSLKELGKQ